MLEIIEIEDAEHQSSIEVSRNAKGEYAWKVKVYEDDAAKVAAKGADYKKVAMAIASD